MLIKSHKKYLRTYGVKSVSGNFSYYDFTIRSFEYFASEQSIRSILLLFRDFSTSIGYTHDEKRKNLVKLCEKVNGMYLLDSREIFDGGTEEVILLLFLFLIFLTSSNLLVYTRII